MGTGVLSGLEMLLQGQPDPLIVLPCQPDDVSVSLALCRPFARRVEATCRPGAEPSAKAERPLTAESPLSPLAPGTA